MKNKKTKYVLRDNRCGIKTKQVQQYGEELERIKANRGKLSPKIVVEEASKQNNPLHQYFEWNNTRAGHLFRLQQARNLVGSIAVIKIVDKQATKQRAWFNIDKGNMQTGASYVSLDEAISTEKYRQKLLMDIIQHLENTTLLMKMFKRNN